MEPEHGTPWKEIPHEEIEAFSSFHIGFRIFLCYLVWTKPRTHSEDSTGKIWCFSFAASRWGAYSTWNSGVRPCFSLCVQRLFACKRCFRERCRVCFGGEFLATSWGVGVLPTAQRKTWVFPKIMVPLNNPFVHRVLEPLFSPSILGVKSPYFWFNTHLYLTGPVGKGTKKFKMTYHGRLRFLLHCWWSFVNVQWMWRFLPETHVRPGHRFS